MSDDGANLGISARRALGTVLGGQPAPTEDEWSTLEEMRARILAAPLPGDGPGIYDRAMETGDAYSLAADSIAHAFLVCEQEDPGVLQRVTVFGPDNCEIEDLWGKPVDANQAVWEAACARWPGADEWWGGATGFMVGFAYNAACAITGLPPAPNPAFMTIELPDE